MSLTADLKRFAVAIGCDCVGVTSADPLPQAERVALDRIDRGLYRGLDWFTPERARASARPTAFLPGARSVVVVGLSYLTDPDEDLQPERSRGIVARCARGADYHRAVRDRLRALADWLRAATGAESRLCVDKDWLFERAIAFRAGIGDFGKNCTLITPGFGSWVFLGAVVTSAALDPDRPPAGAPGAGCGACTRCIDSCPTGALIAPGEVDVARCLSFLTIEWSGDLPSALRSAVGARVYGCDRCQEVCPRNLGVRAGNHSEFGPASGAGASLALVDLLDPIRTSDVSQRFAGTPLARAASHGLRRNALVAAGNATDPALALPVALALGDASPLIRAHAAWALGRIGGRSARRALERARPGESDPTVRAAIDAALAGLT